MVKIAFGIPQHGWLPVIFSAGAFRLEMNVSNVPTNPIESLCDALISALLGIDAEVRWNLEPDEYWFQFKIKDSNILLTIIERTDNPRNSTPKLNLTGDFKSLILPLYRGLKKFASYSYSEANWSSLSETTIEKLTTLVREKKRS
jgi:hypothetical protein